MSDLYERGCRWINDKVGPDRKELKEKRKEQRREYELKEDELKKIEERMKEIRIKHGKESKKYSDLKDEFENKKKKKEHLKERYEKESFKQTMKFIGMDFTYEEILTFSTFLGMISFLVSLTVTAVILQFLDLSIFKILVFGIPPLTIIPTLVFTGTAYYPDLLEKRLKADSIGEIPETINLMTMSMRVNPSLHKALTFASENTKEPISTGLKKISWDVYMKEKISLEESFIDFAVEWGEWNEDLKRALFGIRSAMLEKDEDGFTKALERANEVVIEGTKQKVKDFTKSLQTPTTVLFAIGVILPLIIGAMLPMSALGGLDIGSMTSSSVEQQSTISLPMIIVLMDLAFPLGAFVYSFHILGKRPGTKRPVDITSDKYDYSHLFISAILSISTILVISIFYSSIRFLMPVPILFLPVLPLSYYCLAETYQLKKERKRISKMEDDFPDALFQLGSRIAEGTSLERALVKTSESLRSTEISKLFDEISSSLLVTRSSVEDALFGDEGVLKDHPSDTIKTTMKTVIQISKKDPEEAGKIIMNMANYKRDLQKMDGELKNMLSKSVEMMKGTAMIFAPFTMGIISSLYFMLEDVFTGIGGVELISSVAFSAVLGLYVLLMGAVITYFTKGIENSLDSVEFKYALGKTMLISITIYSISLILGKMLIVNG
ncbi:MAG: hypothetical protein ACLFSM_08675 [Thermoplasmata archaeon]